MKHKCRECSEMAIWKYAPLFELLEKDRYHCDEHIKRGCVECNTDPNTGIEDRDSQGRLYPCSEYFFDDRGFDIE